MADEGYLPPVVASILANGQDFFDMLEKVKIAGDQFDGSRYTTILAADGKSALSTVESTRAEVDAIAAKPIQMRIEVSIDKASLFTSLAAVNTAVAAASASAGGGGGGLFAGLTAGKLLSGIMGGGAGLPLLGGLAAFGSIGSLAGLGPEHVLMTLLGLGGTAVGGALGGGLLGAGALTTAGVGMGTDLAGMGQAAGDIKNVTAAQNNLNQAIAVYGAGSQQAADAQAQLNYTLNSFSPIAQQAVLAAANTAQGFHQAFNTATGAAESTGAQIINMGMQVAEKFLPELGQAAATNMSIIQQSLEGPQGLFQWFGTQGVSIFTQIENHFTAQLPTAMDALTNGAELLIKTLGYLSSQTGGFITKLDGFLRNANGPGFDKWIGDINKLIGYFHLWADIVHNLGRDIVDLFTHDAGTASSILQYLDQLLIRLGDWERSTQGGNQIHNIFEVHKQEIMEILQILPGLLSTFGSFYLTVAPAFTLALTGMLTVIDPVLKAMESTPFGAWILGLTLITWRLGILGTVLSPVVSGLKTLAGTALGGLGISTGAGAATAPVQVAADTMVTAAEMMQRAADTMVGAATENSLGGKILGANGLPLAAAEGGAVGEEAGLFGGVGLATAGVGVAAPIAGALLGSQIGSPGSPVNHLGTIAGGAAGGAIMGSIIPGIGTAIGAVVGGLLGTVATFWPQITGAIGDAFKAIISFFEALPGNVASFFEAIPGAIGSFFGAIGHFFATVNWQTLGQNVGAAIAHLFTGIISLFATLVSRIPGFVANVVTSTVNFFLHIGSSLLGLIGQIPNLAATVMGHLIAFFTGGGAGSLLGAFMSFGNAVVGGVGKVLGGIGGFFLGLLQGFTGTLFQSVSQWFGRVGGGIANFFGSIFSWFSNAWGWLAGIVNTTFSGVANFFGNIFNWFGNLWNWLAGIVGNVINAVKGFFQHIVDFFKGLVANVPNPTHTTTTQGNNGQLFTFASGGFLPAGGWGIAGEAGYEVMHATSSGVQIYSSGSPTTQSALGRGNTSIAISAPVNVTVPPGTSSNMAAQVGTAVKAAVQQEMSGVIRALNGGAYLVQAS